jgi:hypothetical protein
MAVSEPAGPAATESAGSVAFQTVVTVATRLSALALLLLGTLYGLGAVLSASQLQRAHLRPLDTLPLIPLPEILARALALIAQNYEIVFLYLALTAYVALLLRSGFRFRRVPSRLVGGLRTVAYILVALTVPTILLFPWPVVVFFYVPFAVSALAVDRGWLRVPSLSVGLGLWFLFSALSGALIAIWVAPPLPLARLRTISGRTYVGPLIVQTGSYWYLGVGHEAWRAIPAGSVRSATIASRTRTTPSIIRAVGG